MAQGDHRQALIRATKQLLQSKGYPGTGLSEILRESGAPKGSMYHHFPGGKEELGAAAVILAGDEIRDRLVVLRELPPQQAIAQAAEILGGELEASGYGAGSPIATVALEMSSESEVLRQACAAVYESWITMFQDNLTSAGLSEGLARATSLVALSAVEGALLLSRVQQSLEPLRRVTEVLTMLASQLGPNTPEPPSTELEWPPKPPGS